MTSLIQNDAGQADQVADWLRQTRDLGRRAGLELEEQLAGVGLGAGELRVALTGGANVGKSSLINTLLDRVLLPASIRRSVRGLVVRADAADALLVDGRPEPMTALADVFQRPGTVEIELRVGSDWLAASRLELHERQPLDAADTELEELVSRSLEGADLVIHVIDACAPLTRADALLLSRCIALGLPLIPVLWKGDLLAADELETVREYLKSRLEDEIPGVLVEGGRGQTDDLRRAIAAAIDATDFRAVRRLQDRTFLLMTLGQIEEAALASLEAKSLDSDELTRRRDRRGDELELQNLAWAEIEQRLTARRQQVDQELRRSLAGSQTALLELLSFELEKTSDIQSWWNRELPHRLRREMKNLTGQVSSTLTREVAADWRACQQELQRRFQLPSAAPPGGAERELAPVDVDLPSLLLADMGKLRIATRIGTATTILLAAGALASAGLAGATLAIGTLAGLGAEQLAQRRTRQDRSAVADELERLVGKAWLSFETQVSELLRAGYQDLALALRVQQSRWHQAQTRALETEAAAAPAPDRGWQQILDSARRLANSISLSEVP